MERPLSSTYASTLTVPPIGGIIHDVKGVPAAIKAVRESEGVLEMTLLAENEKEIILPLALVELKDDAYHALIAFDEGVYPVGDENKEIHTIPVWEEVMEIGKKMVNSGKGVRIEKKVSEDTEKFNVELSQDEIEIERISVQKIVSPNELPLPRQKGDTYIVPVFKEVLVVEEKICLEEVHIKIQQKTVDSSQSIPLRKEEVSIKRFDEGEA